MGWDGTKITAPVGIGDIAQALAVQSGDAGTLCSHASINKWARYKPCRVAGAYGTLSQQQRVASDWGLGYSVMSVGGSDLGNPTVQTTAAYMLENGLLPWVHNAPRGGLQSPAEPYRLTDFVDGGAAQQRGYYPAAECPVEYNGTQFVSQGGSWCGTAGFRVSAAHQLAVSLADLQYNTWYLGVLVHCAQRHCYTVAVNRTLISQTQTIGMSVDVDFSDAGLWTQYLGATDMPRLGDTVKVTPFVSSTVLYREGTECGQGGGFGAGAVAASAMGIGGVTLTLYQGSQYASVAGDWTGGEPGTGEISWVAYFINGGDFAHQFGNVEVWLCGVSGGSATELGNALAEYDGLTVQGGETDTRSGTASTSGYGYEEYLIRVRKDTGDVLCDSQVICVS